MAESNDDLVGDWLHGVFGVLREEVISIAADFGRRVKAEIDEVADTAGLRPPSAAALLTAVALESTNIAGTLLSRDDDLEDPEEPTAVPAGPAAASDDADAPPDDDED